MKHSTIPHLLTVTLLVALSLPWAAPAAAQVAQPELTATFNCIGIVWEPSQGAASVEAHVWYKESSQGDEYYIRAQNLWYDARTNLPRAYPSRQLQYRGSVVNLEPGTEYEIKVRLWSPAFGYVSPVVEETVTTWQDGYPEAGLVGEAAHQPYLPAFSTEPCIIDSTMSGSEGNYKVFTFDPEVGVACIQVDVDDPEYGDPLFPPPCVLIQTGTHHIILRGLTLRGGRNGVFLEEDVDHIVIEECDITGWGRRAYLTKCDGSDLTYDERIGDENAAIESVWLNAGDPDEIDDDGNRVTHVVVQRNRIAEPRFRSSFWGEIPEWKNWYNQYCAQDGHTFGPLGIQLVNTTGNVVIRYNDVVGGEDHEFSDGIGGHSNFSFYGPLFGDSDVYGNKVTHCWDDGIEAEGGNCNVRIWNNWIDECKVMVAAATTSVGPMYVWGNVVNKGRDTPTSRTGRFMKLNQSGGYPTYGDGRLYVYHNTLLQTDNAGCTFGITRGATPPIHNIVTRNNLLHVRPGGSSINLPAEPLSDRGNDLDYDFCSGLVIVADGQEGNKIVGVPVYDGIPVLPGDDPSNPAYGSFKLAAGTPGVADAEHLRNFNSPGYDMGADQRAWYGPMEFGVYAGMGLNPPDVTFSKTLVFQDGAPDPRNANITYTGHEDTYVSEFEWGLSHSIYHGRNASHQLQYEYSHPYAYNSLHRFDVADCLPEWAEMSKVNFTVISQNPLPDLTVIVAYPLLQSWRENYANWGFRDKWLRWGSAMAPTSVEAETDLQNYLGGCMHFGSTPVGGQPLDFSFLGSEAAVLDWIENPSTNNGFVLIDVFGNTHTLIANNSSMQGYRPQLAITYTLPSVPWEEGGPVAKVAFENYLSQKQTPPPAMKTSLLAAHPNPFNPTTTLRFNLARDSEVKLSIFDVSGRRVTTLVDGHLTAGEHQKTWDGKDDRGGRVASGVYLSHLRVGNETFSNKLVLTK